MGKDLYPLKFHPILKEKIWGGVKLKILLNKKSSSDNIGESWEISDVDGDTSVVSQGWLSGTTLKTLLKTYQDQLIGQKNYATFGTKFPLLVKFIDAKEDLSIQLHPNDELAEKRHNSFGKTEMWYVMQADTDAKLIVGFNRKMSKETYLQYQRAKRLTEILNVETVTKGDTYFIEVGRVHAIGAGVLLAEIQQTSDITYRVYDWDRTDDNGNERELHQDLALDAIDFNMTSDFKKAYIKEKNTANPMVSCPYFTTNFMPIDGELKRTNTHDSFIIYVCVEGTFTITTNSTITNVTKGETVLIPAAIKDFTLNSENANLLEVYV